MGRKRTGGLRRLLALLAALFLSGLPSRGRIGGSGQGVAVRLNPVVRQRLGQSRLVVALHRALGEDAPDHSQRTARTTPASSCPACARRGPPAPGRNPPPAGTAITMPPPPVATITVTPSMD